MNPLTLDQLIKKGLKDVYLPYLVFVILSVCVAFYYPRISESSKFIKSILIGLLIFSFLGSWAWWSYSIVKWKIWAFSKVNAKDAYDLYIKAVTTRLIWPTGSIFNKTEYWTKADKQQWNQLDPLIKKLFELPSKKKK